MLIKFLIKINQQQIKMIPIINNISKVIKLQKPTMMMMIFISSNNLDVVASSDHLQIKIRNK